MRLSISLFAIVLTAIPAFATSYASPVRHDVFSPNREFVLDVNPETKRHTVYAVQDRATPLWSFSAPVWQAPFLLSNDGAVVVELEWRHVKVDDVAATIGVTFWNRQGEFRTYPLTELCPDPPKTQDVGFGPIGDFWRTWYTDVSQDDETFTLRTTRGIEYRFRMSDGELIAWHERGRSRWIVGLLVVTVMLGGAVGLILARRARRVRPSEPPAVS